jgi:hypothetical protein
LSIVFAVSVDSSKSGVLHLQTTSLDEDIPLSLEPGAARKSHLETAAGKTQA